jgi:hypothetical protein
MADRVSPATSSHTVPGARGQALQKVQSLEHSGIFLCLPGPREGHLHPAVCLAFPQDVFMESIS